MVAILLRSQKERSELLVVCPIDFVRLLLGFQAEPGNEIKRDKNVLLLKTFRTDH